MFQGLHICYCFLLSLEQQELKVFLPVSVSMWSSVHECRHLSSPVYIQVQDFPSAWNPELLLLPRGRNHWVGCDTWHEGRLLGQGFNSIRNPQSQWQACAHKLQAEGTLLHAHLAVSGHKEGACFRRCVSVCFSMMIRLCAHAQTILQSRHHLLASWRPVSTHGHLLHPSRGKVGMSLLVELPQRS